jgi:hypothetical protein
MMFGLSTRVAWRLIRDDAVEPRSGGRLLRLVEPMARRGRPPSNEPDFLKASRLSAVADPREPGAGKFLRRDGSTMEWVAAQVGM